MLIMIEWILNATWVIKYWYLTYFRCLAQCNTNKRPVFPTRCRYWISKPMKNVFSVYLFVPFSSFFLLLFPSLSVSWLMKNGFLFGFYFLRLRVLYFYKIIIKYIIRSISFSVFLFFSSLSIEKRKNKKKLFGVWNRTMIISIQMSFLLTILWITSNVSINEKNVSIALHV